MPRTETQREWLHPACLLKEVTQAMRLPTYLRITSLPDVPGPIRESTGLRSESPPRPPPAEPPSRGHWHPDASILTLWKNLQLGTSISLSAVFGLAPVVPSDHPKETKAVFSGCAEPAALREDEKHPFCTEASLPLAEDTDSEAEEHGGLGNQSCWPPPPPLSQVSAVDLLADIWGTLSLTDCL